LRIGGYPCIKFRYGNVRDIQLLPTLFFIYLEYFVERLLVLSVVRLPSESESQARRYLIFRSDGKRTVFRLFGWKMCQDIGNVSGNIGSGGERHRLVAIATNGHFPARKIEVYEPLGLRLKGQNGQRKKTYDTQI
jgi:hypothetical protein